MTFALSVSLAACSDDDVEDSVEADITACRTIALSGVMIQSTTPSPEAVADYSLAIANASAAIVEDEVSPQIASATIDVIEAWNTTKNAMARNEDVVGQGGAMRTAEERLLADVLDTCPEGALDN